MPIRNARPSDRVVVGVLADTHGLLRQEVLDALRGVDRIVHAGDIGSAEVLEQLESVAPVTAVRGNNDRGPWARTLPDAAIVHVADTALYVVHDLADLSVDPVAAGCSVVISGHSHKPTRDQRDGVVFFNPGSAGPRRFKLPVCVGRLSLGNGQVEAEHQVLEG